MVRALFVSEIFCILIYKSKQFKYYRYLRILFAKRGLGLRLLHAAAIIAIAMVSFFRSQPSSHALGGTSGFFLAYEPFAVSGGALHGASAGFGWSTPWQVQNGHVGLPGYNTATATPLVVSGVVQSGNYAVGGAGYLMAGRTLDTSATGSFSSLLDNGLIGKAGQSLYFGVLLRKDSNTDDEMSVTLHPGGSPAWYVPSPGVSIGHFGGASNNAGKRYWSLKLAGVVYRTTVPVVVGQAANLLVRIDFPATTGGAAKASLYVNPTGSTLPATANASATTTNSLAFQSLAWNAGTTAGQSSVDEIRFAGTYAAVTSGSVPPPATPANVSAMPGDRQVALSWSPVSGATAYQIYQSLGGVSHLEATTANSAFTDTGLTNGTAYGFSLVAVGPSGQSAASAPLTAVPRGPAAPPVPALGTNLSEVVDYSRELPFVDVFHSARAWIPQQQGAAWGQGPALKLDSNGWILSLQPGQYAETILLDNSFGEQSHYPVGNYTLLYDGQGTIEFDLQSASVVSQTPGRMVVNVPPGGNGVFLKVTATNASNPLRNIRFIMPGFEATYQTHPFNPAFTARLQGFKVLRFMEWSLVNGSGVTNWTDRALPTDYTYSIRGVPLEVQIQLANAVKTTPWLNLPVKATDDFMQQFATLVKAQLSPSLNFYLEYSNETWNGMFSQNTWLRSQGVAAGLNTDPTIAAADYTALRATKMFSIFQTVFGGTSRMIRVIASQADNSWLSEQTLAFQNAFASADALAIAPYFNCDDRASGGFGMIGDPLTANQVAAMTADQLIDIELAKINGCALQQMQSNAAVARKYGLKLVAYEGGQSLVGYNGTENNAAVTAVFIASNRSTRMAGLYAQYLQNWISAGGDLFVNFTDVTAYTKYGSFGALEYQDQDINSAPKFQALATFMAQHP